MRGADARARRRNAARDAAGVLLNDYLAARGEGALDALVKGYFGQDTENPTELDAQVAYRRSWNRALNEAFAAASILYADGTEDDLAALFENEQSFFSPALVETLESARYLQL